MDIRLRRLCTCAYQRCALLRASPPWNHPKLSRQPRVSSLVLLESKTRLGAPSGLSTSPHVVPNEDIDKSAHHQLCGISRCLLVTSSEGIRGGGIVGISSSPSGLAEVRSSYLRRGRFLVFTFTKLIERLGNICAITICPVVMITLRLLGYVLTNIESACAMFGCCSRGSKAQRSRRSMMITTDSSVATIECRSRKVDLKVVALRKLLRLKIVGPEIARFGFWFSSCEINCFRSCFGVHFTPFGRSQKPNVIGCS